jgi:hypothetical protein
MDPLVTRRDRWKLISGLVAFGFLVVGGIAMCCLYERGAPLDARGYWIVSVMLAPLVLVGLLFSFWRPPADEDTDEM